MALAPSLRPLLIVGKPDAPHTLDIFRMCQFCQFLVIDVSWGQSIMSAPLGDCRLLLSSDSPF